MKKYFQNNIAIVSLTFFLKPKSIPQAESTDQFWVNRENVNRGQD